MTTSFLKVITERLFHYQGVGEEVTLIQIRRKLSMDKKGLFLMPHTNNLVHRKWKTDLQLDCMSLSTTL